MKTFLLLIGLTFCAIELNAAAANKPSPTRPPNIIFILADDLGYGDLGCYGQERIQTPNIDRLAAEGMRFTQCYAGSTVCAPSRSALMTGQHTGHTRVRGNNAYPLQPDDVTVAEVLKDAGYTTALVGKWGLGLQNTTGAPSKQGFDEFVGFLGQTHAHEYYPTSIWRHSSVANAAFPEFGGKEFIVPLDGNTNGQRGVYVHDVFTKSATNFVTSNREKPFFLYLAYTAPHANNELGRATGNGMEVPSDEPYSKENWPQPEKNKAAMIARLDRDIGKLMEFLKGYGLDTNTIVFFTSDNGPHNEGGVKAAFHNSSGPLRGIKRDMYEGGIRVPMIVRWPGQIKAGAMSEFPWAFWDILPTAAAIAGATNSLPKNLDGMSVLPTLLGKEQKPHEFFYWEFHEKGSKQAVRMGDWKAVRLAMNKPLELYNLKTDLGETNNVAAAHPEIVAKIGEYLKTARRESPRWPLALPSKAGERAPAESAADVN